MKAILLDIEGTTTPVDFVHEVLFPYSRERVGRFVATHFRELQHEIEQLAEAGVHDETYNDAVDPLDSASVAAYLRHLIDEDRKSTPLKTIQGMIWREGYEAGELHAPVFEDVPPAFRRWSERGLTVAIYSSGSELAQRLLFRHTDHGDLTPYISAYFDTNIGGKRATHSYEHIAEYLGLSPTDIIFISDVREELDAAHSAHMLTLLCVRDGGKAADQGQHRVVRTFDDIYH